jgi:hypothetical protein
LIVFCPITEILHTSSSSLYPLSQETHEDAKLIFVAHGFSYTY